MPIKPIDLQTLFMQMDKVSKEQSQLKEGMAIQRAVQGAEQLKREEDRAKTVKETRGSEEGSEKIGDRKGRGETNSEGRKREGREDGEGEEPVEILKDPLLGRHIDIQG